MRLRTLALSSFLGLSTIFLASCASGTSSNSGGSGGGNSDPLAPTTATYLYSTRDFIFQGFPVSSTGNTTPPLTVSPASGSTYGYVFTDGAGKIYVAAVNSTAATITVSAYTSATSGKLALDHTFTFAFHYYPSSYAADRLGNVYVDEQNTYVLRIPAGSTGTVTPTILSTTSGISAMATDKNNNFWYAVDSIIYEMPAGFTNFNTTPLTSFKTSYSSGLNTISAIAVDNATNIYICGTDPNYYATGVYVYPSNANGLSTIRFINNSGSAGLNAPNAIAVDGSGNIFLGERNTGRQNVYREYTLSGSSQTANVTFTDPVVTYNDGGYGIAVN